METDRTVNTDIRPSREEADTALRESEHLRSQFQDQPVPVPAWYYPVLGVCLAGLSLAQLLPTLYSILVIIALAAAVGFSIGSIAGTARYSPRMNSRIVFGGMLPVGLVIVGAFILDRVYQFHWVWYAMAALGLLLALVLGLCHRRTMRYSAQ